MIPELFNVVIFQLKEYGVSKQLHHLGIPISAM